MLFIIFFYIMKLTVLEHKKKHIYGKNIGAGAVRKLPIGLIYDKHDIFAEPQGSLTLIISTIE